ncbi:unnamed protein product [Eruca vesicaria subsp. sativa]|uniref:Secreted protein n=1 Tax=Eruca vesicaria subsp. sativa TaxID=29727 RepID=A0ABC8J039_ERUVS|nr:unnamed protein product [Eruca vesicaria subsp. sativa]
MFRALNLTLSALASRWTKDGVMVLASTHCLSLYVQQSKCCWCLPMKSKKNMCYTDNSHVITDRDGRRVRTNNYRCGGSSFGKLLLFEWGNTAHSIPALEPCEASGNSFSCTCIVWRRPALVCDVRSYRLLPSPC